MVKKEDLKEIEKNNEKIDVAGINVIINLLKKMLKIGFIVTVILGIYGLIIIGKEMGLFKFILNK